METNNSIRIAFDPDLNISSAIFTNAWNNSPSHRKVASARADAQTGSQFVDPLLVQAGLVALGSIATGLLTNAIWDLIKELLIEQGVTKKTTYQEVSLPDGTRLLIISVEEAK
jgi:hypothetical protein